MSDTFMKGVTIGTEKKNEEGVSQVKEQEFSAEETANQIRMNEEDFLQGLVEAASFSESEEQTSDIEIARKNKVLFRFRVRGLSEREYTDCKKKGTKYVRNKSLGIRMPEDTDSSKYRAAIIYAATIPEDRKKLWDNKDAWEALRKSGKQIVRGLDVIEECLLAGEKDRVIEVIDRLSGYDDNIEEETDNLEETIKN